MATERIQIEIREDGSRVVKRNLEEVADQATALDYALKLMKQSFNRLASSKTLPASAIAEVKQLQSAVKTLQAIGSRGLLDPAGAEASIVVLKKLRDSVVGVMAEVQKIQGQGRAKGALIEASGNIGAAGEFARQQVRLSQSNHEAAAAMREVEQAEMSLEQATNRLIEVVSKQESVTGKAKHQVNELGQAVSKTAANTAAAVGPSDALTRSAKGQSVAAAGATAQILRLGAAWYYIRRAMYALGGVFFLRELKEYADQWVSVTNRIKISAKSTEQATAVTEELYKASQRTRADMMQMAKVYQRGAQASKELGATQRELIQFTEGVGMALAVQGVSAHEAYGALHQLGQALGSARIFAEEFNSINEAAPRILQSVADNLDAAGGSVARLKGLVTKGQVSNKQFFDAFMKDIGKLKEEFAKATPTIAQAYTVLQNALSKWIGTAAQSTGITRAVADAIMWVARNINDAAKAIGVLSVAITALYLPKIIGWIKSLATAFRTLAVAIAMNPVGAMAVALSTVASALYFFRDDIILSTEQIETFNAELIDTERNALKASKALLEGELKGGKLEIDFKTDKLKNFTEAIQRAGDKLEVSAALLKDFEGFSSTAYWDVNAYRTGYGSDTVTLADGSIQDVVKGMTTTLVDANRDLVRRIGEFQGTVKNQITPEKFDQFNAAQQAVLTSIAYNYGELPKRIVAAIKEGGNVGQAIASYAKPGDVNYNRRMAEASIFSGSSETSAAAVTEQATKLKTEIAATEAILEEMGQTYAITAGEAGKLVAIQLTFGDYVKGAWDTLVDSSKEFVGGLSQVNNSLSTQQTWWGMIGRSVTQIWGAVIKMLFNSVDLSIGIVRTIANLFDPNRWVKFGKAIGAAFQLIVDEIKRLFAGAWNWIADKWNDSFLAKRVGTLDKVEVPKPSSESLKVWDDFWGDVEEQMKENFGANTEKWLIDRQNRLLATIRANARKYGIERFNEAERLRRLSDLDTRPPGGETQINADEAKKAADALEKLMDKVDPVGAALRDLNEASKTIIDAFDLGATDILDEWGTAQKRVSELDTTYQTFVQNLEAREAKLKVELVGEKDPKKLADLQEQLDSVHRRIENGTNLYLKYRKSLEEALTPMEIWQRENAKEKDLLKLSNGEREIATDLLKAYETALKNNIPLTNETIRLIESEVIALHQANKVAAERQTLEEQFYPQRQQYMYQLQALADLYTSGSINATQYHLALAQINEEANNASFGETLLVQMDLLALSIEGFTNKVGEAFGQFTDQFIRGMSDAIAESIVYWKSLKETMYSVATSVLQTLISAIIQLIVKMGLLKIMGQTTEKAAIASAQVSGKAIALAYAQAAANVSTATFGSAALAGAAAIKVAYASALPKFEEGGFTGDMAKNKVAGVVHGREFVVNADATKRYRDLLELINATGNQGGKAFMSGGYASVSPYPVPPAVATQTSGTGDPSPLYITVENNTPANIQVQRISPDEVRIIAREEAFRTVQKEAPRVISSDLANPNGRVSTALRKSTNVERKR